MLHEKSLSHGTIRAARDIANVDRACISLRDLLDGTTSNSPSIGLSTEECLHLAVILSYSMLQLYATPWISSNWCTQSIYFASFVNHHDHINVKYPYIMSKIGDATRDPMPLPTLCYHPDLVSIGIMLLELSEKKSIHQWWQEQTSKRNPGPSAFFSGPLPEDVQGKAEASWRWFEDDSVAERMAFQYRQAFRCCLNVYALDIFPKRRMTLVDEGFREAVFRNIVVLLEEAYLAHTTYINGSTLMHI